jgi:hypothetical protein
MIVTQLKEGLGNQLFQYFFTRSFNIEDYSFDISFYNSNFNRSLEITNFKNIKLKFPHRQLINPVIIKDYFTWKDYNIENNKDYYFDGYWQNKKVFEKNKQLIFKELRFSEKTTKYVKKKYPFLFSEESISMHIRRGDYTKLKEHYYLLDHDYYNDALSNFNDNIKIIIFSDDINWCKSTINYKNAIFIQETPCIDMYIMSICSHNIIANSTFSLWGAYLNQNNGKTICPRNWFKENYSLFISDGNEKDCAKNLILDNWIRI